jgi:hypothetical protein
VHAVIGQVKAPEVFAAKGGVEIVFDALRTHISQARVVGEACKTLAWIACWGRFGLSCVSLELAC